MQNLKVIFFGSTTDSVIVLQSLSNLRSNEVTKFAIVAIVTQPPRAVGRKQIVTPTSVELWAQYHRIPVLSFPPDPSHQWLYANEQQVIDTLQPFHADVLVSACYGQRIPIQAIQATQFGGLNVHPSLLPRWRGADPVPWTILTGDHQTAVTVVTLSEKFDEGQMVAQKKLPITDKDTSDPLRTKLFTMGAQLLIESLPNYLNKAASYRYVPESRVQKTD